MYWLSHSQPSRRVFLGIFLALAAVLLAFIVLAARPASAQSFPTATVSAVMADVYAQPGLNAPKITSLPQGTTLPLIGWRTADSAWVLVGVGPQHAWVQTHQITSDFPLANLVVGSGPGAIPAPDAGRSTIPGATVTSYALNVRSGPSIYAAIIAQVPRGTALELAGRDASANWAQVRLADGRTGWVSARYIRPNDGFPLSSLPVTERSSVPVGGKQATHVVQPGENLFRIALRYGVALDTLVRWNGIQNPALIYAGQVLVIPS